MVATWSAGTLLAVGLAWWAVGRVSSEVTDRPSSPISDREVAAALGAGPAGTAPASSTVPAGEPSGAGPSAPSTTPGPAGGIPGPTSPRPTTTAARGTAVPATSPAATAAPPTTTPAPLATATTATIDSVGGQVAVRYDSGGVELLWASPEPGFTADVGTAGPDQVDVRFRSDGHESRVRAYFRDGVPDREVREDADGD